MSAVAEELVLELCSLVPWRSPASPRVIVVVVVALGALAGAAEAAAPSLEDAPAPPAPEAAPGELALAPPQAAKTRTAEGTIEARAARITTSWSGETLAYFVGALDGSLCRCFDS
jgi:hypothetical protein